MAITKEINGKSITFDLAEDSDGNVALKATHINGDKRFGGLVAGVTAKGRLIRYKDIAEDFGFKLQPEGHIKQDKE